MADEIANLIATHKIYLAANRALRNDIVKAANSIGYPSDDAFITLSADLSRTDRRIYSEMQNITESLRVLTNKVERLGEICRGNKAAAGGVVVGEVERERIRACVRQEVECVLEAVMDEIEDVVEGELEAGDAEAAAAKDAAALLITDDV